tara:strand:- start:47 stop:463 length:417 start_codon:yes stop_codon:yes gene_type:complete
MRILLIFLFNTLCFLGTVQANEMLVGKSLICKTETFPVKGGFNFSAPDKLVRYNILWNSSKNEEFIEKTSHCYTIINDEVAVSESSKDSNCGAYSSFINLNTLVYTIPTSTNLLTADCVYFNGDIEEKIESSINVIYN